MFHVELDIFSGRPNPTWVLDAGEERELVTRLLDRSVPTAPLELTEWRLGYRGFVVHATGATAATLSARGLPTAFRVRDGLVGTVDLAAERWLLLAGPEHGLAPATADWATAQVGTRCGRTHRTSTTKFTKWNGGTWQYDNNCYNYGANWRTDTFAQPGYGSGALYEDITVPEIIRASISDGFRVDCASSGRMIKVWFCLVEHGDFHWYRETRPVDGEVRWCHKMGGGPAHSTDESGNPITDPRTCDRGLYVTEGTFLWCEGRACTNVDGWWDGRRPR